MSISEVTESKPNVATSSPAEEKPVVLSLENVSKRFCRDLKRSLYYGLVDIGRELIGGSARPDLLRKNEFWALQNIDLELRAGEALGIVGINGCGKTTLMRVISGLIKPTTGRVTVRGRLAPMLALGAGFNPVLTGRENIFANMSILGLTYKEIQERFDDVVEFSEVGYAIDAPVQTYSSGMVARLGFACAINTQPDILLLDEVLAVGDMNFRRKCVEKILELRTTGMSLVIVHHSPAMLLSIADRALYLRKGRVLSSGMIGPVVQQYERDLVADMPSGVDLAPDAAVSAGSASSQEAEFVEARFHAVQGDALLSGKNAAITARIRVKQPIRQLNFEAMIFRLPGLESASPDAKPKRVLRMLSRRDGGSLPNVQPGEYDVTLDLPGLGLRDGVYQFTMKMHRPVRVTLATFASSSIVVGSSEVSTDEYRQPRSWKVTARDGSVLAMERVGSSVEDADELLAVEQNEKFA